MSETIDKINEYLNEDDLLDRMFDFITSLNEEQINEDQAIEIVDIVDIIDEEEIDEIQRVKINPAEKRERKKAYKKNKQKIKITAKRFRKTAKFKKYVKKKKIKSKSGKTSSGKRIRKFL